jgi:hypothetical protein
MAKRFDDTPDREFILRLLEVYTLDELLEFDDLEASEALELLVQYGALCFDNVPV